MTLICFSTSAQPTANLYWVRYFNQVHFNSKWSWQNEIDERRSIQPDRQRQFIMHSYGNFTPTEKTDFSAGFSGSWVTNAKDLTVPEVRAFQSVTQQLITTSNFNIHFRLRIEERFFHNTDSENMSLIDGYRFKLRSRYRIQFQHTSKNQNWKARIADEIMYHTESSNAWKFDQNRVYLGIERKLTKQLGLEMGYMLLHALSRDNIIYSNNLRTTLYHRISL